MGITLKDMKLYELANLRDFLDEKLDALEGELTPELEAELDAIGGAIDEKIERIALYIREQELECEKVDAEIKRLTALKRARANAADRLKKGYLLRLMQRLEKTKVVGLLCTVGVQYSAARVEPTLPLAEAFATLEDRGGADGVIEQVVVPAQVIPERVEYRLNEDYFLGLEKRRTTETDPALKLGWQIVLEEIEKSIGVRVVRTAYVRIR